MDRKKRAFGYVRVSTQEQADSGLGVEAQRAALQTEAARRGWDLTLFEDLGMSGVKMNPALRSALDLLAAGISDVLMVSKMDRLARSTRHTADILDRAKGQGWALVALDLDLDLTTPQGQLTANVLASTAQFERDMISTRIKDALAAKRRRGEPLGRPSGIPAHVRARIVEMRDGGESFAKIATALTADSIPTPTGLNTWQESTARRAYAATRRAISASQAREAAR